MGVLSLGPWHARRAERIKGDGKSAQGHLLRSGQCYDSTRVARKEERPGLEKGLMEPELGSLGELWIKGGAGFQEDKGSSSGCAGWVWGGGRNSKV